MFPQQSREYVKYKQACTVVHDADSHLVSAQRISAHDKDKMNDDHGDEQRGGNGRPQARTRFSKTLDGFKIQIGNRMDDKHETFGAKVDVSHPIGSLDGRMRARRATVAIDR